MMLSRVVEELFASRHCGYQICAIVTNVLSLFCMPIRGSRRPNVVPITAPSFSTPPRSYLYRKIAFGFIGLTVVLVAAILWLSSVKAEVVVHVKKEPVAVDTVVELAKTPKAGQLLGRVAQGTFENRKEFPIRAAAGDVATTTPVALVPSSTPTTTAASTTTTVISPNAIARGKVKITNTYSRAQPLVRTTRLLTADGKLYRINQGVTVPAGGSVEVEIYADKPGPAFAIGPTKFTIPGLFVDLQKLIYAESSAAFTLDTSTPAPAAPTAPRTPTTTTPRTTARPGALTPTQEEIDAAERQAIDETLERAKRQLASEVTESASLEGVYFTKVRKEILPGSTPQSFIVYVQADVTAVYYPKDDMLVLVRTKLREKVPSDRELIPFDGKSIRYQIESVDPRVETATVRVQTDAAARLTPASDALKKENLVGKSKQEVIDTLKKVDGVESVEVNTSPGWLRKIPSMQERVELKVE